ncbi:hypothetical protein KUTeg_014658 [Tegillarca granosa]|uniref:PiggyBac transposable element-derived protein domain-containing protein n=1 Tax=Tegillarca granosa TaxID=220873 RepID=A0ABQ9ERE8_TEGGR|nr:hypothetical protein KUTeg_014658 [Tegillarca granosa]
MESSDSGDEFEGWEPEDAIEVQEKYDHHVENALDESDIDVSSVSSGDLTDSEPENESDSDDPDLNLIRDEWSRDTRGINIGQFTHQTGPNHCLTLDARPLEYFFLLMPEIFYEVVAHETNLYAEQKIRQNGPDPRWHLTTPEEIRAYIGINIMFGIKQLPRLWCYWSPDPRFGDTWISKIMPKTRFLKLTQYLHLRDTSDTPDPPPPKHYDHLMFRADVAEQLVAGFTSRKHRKGRRSKNLNVEVAAATLGAHKAVHVEGRKKVCRQCSKEGRRTPKGRFIETMFKCFLCDIPLCKVGCFAEFHDKHLQN